LSRQNTRLSTDTVVCYWTRKSNAFAGAFGIGIEVDEEKVQAKPAHIAEMYKSLWKGRPYKLEQTDEFYSLVLSGGQGRATVRDWIETNTQYVVDSLAAYFRDIVKIFLYRFCLNQSRILLNREKMVFRRRLERKSIEHQLIITVCFR
jgi:hypothetical protein